MGRIGRYENGDGGNETDREIEVDRVRNFLLRNIYRKEGQMRSC